MRIVIDSSYAIALFAVGESRPASEEIVVASNLLAPELWRLELANWVRSAQLRRKLTASDVPKLLDAAEALSVEIVSTPLHTIHLAHGFAAMHELTAYDAAYVALAQRESTAIATLDAQIARAATRLGLIVYQ